MGLLGWATGGASGFGPSTVNDSLPFKGWKEISTWLEEAVDAVGLELDWRNLKFFRAAARASLLDPTYTPGTLDPADVNIANATTAPSSAVSRDSMLDVLLYIALGYYPADTNLTVAQKQALAQVGWTALRRKGTRLQTLNLASKLTDGVAYGWTVPPFNFSVVAPDGTPTPGAGVWVPPNATTPAVNRPWFMLAVRRLLSNGMAPDWAALGVGYSQFRAGYSAAGETVFPASSRINLLAHEHIDAWSSGVPVGWTQVGAGTLTQSTSAAQINWEFTGSAAVLDLSSAGLGVVAGLQQQATYVNDQVVHRLQVDYAYVNAQGVSVLLAQITDTNRDGNTYYWNPTTATWSTTSYSITLPPSSTRARFACDVTMQASSATATVQGTTGVTLKLFATSDGTATTKTTYTLYRAGLYERFDVAIESAALGERTLWLPLGDSPGWSTAARGGGGGVLLEPAAVDRSSYKLANTVTAASFPYHPALNGRGFRSHRTWTNLVKDSNLFSGANWAPASCTTATNAQLSPLVGETSPTATQLTATSVAAQIGQQVSNVAINPASRTFVAGVWVKKISADASPIKVQLGSTTVYTTQYPLVQSQGWQLLTAIQTFAAGDTANLFFRLQWASGSATSSIALADAYVYEVTGTTGVLYPPVVRTVGSTPAVLNPTSCQALTASQGVNVLHPLTQRALASVVRGALGLMFVPTFNATSQPNGVIFDVGQSAAVNRVVLRVNTGALELKRWDASGNTWTASLTLTSAPTPAAGSMTWARDTAVVVRCLWDANSSTLSAGNGSAAGVKPGSWAPSDASVAVIAVGCDITSANQIDAHIMGIEVVQLGAPTT